MNFTVSLSHLFRYASELDPSDGKKVNIELELERGEWAGPVAPQHDPLTEEGGGGQEQSTQQGVFPQHQALASRAVAEKWATFESLREKQN